MGKIKKYTFTTLLVINVILSIVFFITTKDIWFFSLDFSVWGLLWLLAWYSLILNVLMIIFKSKLKMLIILYLQFFLVLLFLIKYVVYDYGIIDFIVDTETVKNIGLSLYVQNFLKEIFIDKFIFTFLFILEFVIPIIYIKSLIVNKE